MRIREVLVLTLVTMFAFAAIAGEKHRTKIEIAVDGDEGNHEIHFDSDDAGFSLDELEVGESRAFSSEDGSEATVTRTEDGFEFDAGGHTIDLAHHHEVGDLQGLHDDGAENVFVVKDVDEVKVIKTDAPGSVTIITGRTLDDETRRQIREILESAGEDGDVLFIDSSELEGGDATEHRKVRIVTKELDVTN